MARNRMSTTSVQLSDRQFKILEDIKKEKDFSSNAEVLRIAFDFYAQNQFPQIGNCN